MLGELTQAISRAVCSDALPPLCHSPRNLIYDTVPTVRRLLTTSQSGLAQIQVIPHANS